MLNVYLPICIFLVVGIAVGLSPIILSGLIGPKNPSRDKQSPYECGFEPFDDARMKFDVRFYLVAILFIIFDLEIAFLFPWAVILKSLSWTQVIAMGVFLLVLTIGFIYEWKKGALDWE